MKTWAKILGLALVCLWIYFPCLHGTWLWDDGLEITQNAAIQSPGGWWSSWVHPQGMDYFPLKGSFQWLEWHFWGADPLGYHVANLVLHFLSALLVWRLFLAIEMPAAFFGCLLFAVHPLAVESVAWISELKNTLSLPPLLLSCIAFVEFDRTGSRAAQVRSLVWFMVALLCKTSVVMLPFVILVFAWWRRGRIGVRDLAASAPFFAVAVALGAITVWFQSTRAIGLAGTPQSLGLRVAEAGWSLADYAGMFVWPYGLAPVYSALGATWTAALPWAGTLGVLGVLWWKRASWGRGALLGAGWYLLNVVPVLGIIPMAYSRVSPRADHFAYLPMVGLAGLTAAGLCALWRLLGKRMGKGIVPRLALAFIPALVLVAFAMESHAYAAHFASEKALWSFGVERDPQAWLARNNLGKELLAEGQPGAASEQFKAAIGIQPDSPEAHANLGNALEAEDLPQEARVEYTASLAIDPNFAGGHYSLGLSFLHSQLYRKAGEQFRECVRLDPGFAQAYNNLGLTLAGLGQLDDAMEQYRLALSVDPKIPEAHLNLGNALFREGRLENAIAEYREALRQEPGYSGAHFNLGQALANLGRTSEADAEFKAARASAKK